MSSTGPSTPQSRSRGSPSTPSSQTGTWKHPRLDEIARRQNATTLTERDVNKVMWNIGSLVALWAAGQFLETTFPSLLSWISFLQPYPTYVYNLGRLLLLFNCVVALRPLYARRDDVSDIALTPGQRQLLGLAQDTSGKPTFERDCVTPPRYPRSASGSQTPSSPVSPSLSAGKLGHTTPGSNGSHGSSGSPRGGGGSPYSPSASPLYGKMANGNGGSGGGGAGSNSRRQSYGSPSPLGPGKQRMMGLESPGTPSTPVVGGKGSSVGLNNRWLYERGRGSPGSGRLL